MDFDPCTIDAYASEPHYLSHVASVWRALPPELRGNIYSPCRGVLDLDNSKRTNILKLKKNHLTLVASFKDLKYARRMSRQIVLMEHGSGQSYSNGSNYYVGGRDRACVAATLMPNFQAAARHTVAHPAIPAYVTGSIRVDELRAATATRLFPVISFHWDCRIVPETRTALPHYKSILASIKHEFSDLQGHGHPRIATLLKQEYTRAGIRFNGMLEDVASNASVYIADNTSSMFEIAALDKPIVVLNAPWYRRDANHGGRFWRWADVGIQVNSPHNLIDAIHSALEDRTALSDARRQIVNEVYPYQDSAADKTVEAIHDIVNTYKSSLPATG